MSDAHHQNASAPPKRRGQVVGPITTLGVGIIALAVVAYVAGWQLGWIELLVVAAACAVALVIAVPFVIGRSRLTVTRAFDPQRVSAGDTVAVRLTATNGGRTPSRRVSIDERVGVGVRTLQAPGLLPGADHEIDYEIHTNRRARLRLGPAELTRADPLGLLRRSISQSDTDTCWVYPRTTLVAPLPVGFAKDLEGPTSDTSPAGDVAFHAVRPYATGDDRRHIHWLSTARTGELMVRHYVDNRRPHLAILLDNGADAYTNESFEDAVSVAASLAASMIDQRLPVSVRVGRRTVLGDRIPGGRDTALEALTECTIDDLSANDLVVNVAEFIRTERRASALAIVTGTRSADDLLASVVHARRHARTLVIPVGDAAETAAAVPGARVIKAPDLPAFGRSWNAMVGG